jgi:DnaJ family protein B protein 12
LWRFITYFRLNVDLSIAIYPLPDIYPIAPKASPHRHFTSMEVNKEEALRCLSIAQKHRNASNLPSALKFAKKSISLYTTPEATAMITIIEREIETGGSGSSTPSPMPNGSGTRASGVEEHVTSAHSRPGHGTGTGTGSGKEKKVEEEKGKGKREYTAKQMEVVVRVKKCKHHEYYEILACESVSLVR